MAAVAIVALMLTAAGYWLSDEAVKHRADCFRTSSDFADYARALRYEASQTSAVSEQQRLREAAVDCDATSWFSGGSRFNRGAMFRATRSRASVARRVGFLDLARISPTSWSKRPRGHGTPARSSALRACVR